MLNLEYETTARGVCLALSLTALLATGPGFAMAQYNTDPGIAPLGTLGTPNSGFPSPGYQPQRGRRLGVSAPGASSRSMLFPGDRGKPIVDVRIVGNKNVSADTITSYLRTRAQRQFDPEIVQADKRRLQKSGLFADTNILTQSVNGGVVVTFQVFERPTLQYIKFHGNRGVTDKVLTKESGLKVGDALHSFSIQEARRKVEDFYHRKGYPQARIAVREGTGNADRGAVLEVSEGPMQRIVSVSFVGNTIATDGRLKTQIQSKPDVIPYLAIFRGKGRPKQDRRRCRSPDRLLPQSGFLSCSDRPRNEIRFDATMAQAEIRHRRRATVLDPKSIGRGKQSFRCQDVRGTIGTAVRSVLPRRQDESRCHLAS